MNCLGFGRIFDALRSQAALYRGTCGRFSRLIIAHCEMDNDTLYELVDSCADIVCQRGRFTNNPQVYPYHYPFTRFTPPLRPPRLPAQKPSVLLPDADLDGPPPGGP
ncbi:hypothetical protein QCA50_006194 [Cerrena zonata]|uniref:Uncharacterized protein n=1 Tax=Cerrena zonata TaxID=2478898 RepID=A0AAW0GEA1_9APHY